MYTAKATDAAPNTSPASAARTITVDTVDPTVTDRSPLADATGVAVDVTVSAELSEALDPATVSATSVTLVAGLTAVPASVDYDELTDTISLNPDADLEPGTTYTVSLGTTIEDLAGNALSATSWDFATLNPADTTPPDAPTLVLDAVSDTGTSNSDRVTKDSTPDLSGSAEAGSTVTVRDGTTVVAVALAAGDGTWTATADALAEGERTPDRHGDRWRGQRVRAIDRSRHHHRHDATGGSGHLQPGGRQPSRDHQLRRQRDRGGHGRHLGPGRRHPRSRRPLPDRQMPGRSA